MRSGWSWRARGVNRWLAAVLSLAVAASVLEAAGSTSGEHPASSAVAAEPTVTEADNLFSAQQYARRQHRRVEVTSERTESTTTYANADGTLTTEAKTQPFRIRRDGEWIPVDTTLVSDSTGVHPRAVPDALTLSGGGNTALATLADGATTMGLGWTSALPAPVLSGDTATYRDVAPGTDLVVTATRIGFEVSVVLTARPKNPKVEFRLPLTGTGLTAASHAASGSVALTDRGGKRRGYIRPTVVFDAHRDPVSGEPTRSVSMPTTVRRNGARQELVLTAPTGLLTDPATAFPVTIDPSVHLGEINDMWIADNGTGGAGSQELRVGYYNGNTAVHRSLMKFDTSKITGAVVSSATLALYQWYTPSSCTPKESRIYAAAGPFDDTTTWATQPQGIPTIYGSSTQVYGSANCPADWVRYDVTGLTKNWASTALPNYGLFVRSAVESDTSAWWRFSGMDTTIPSQLPSLAVTYNFAPNTPTTPTTAPPSACASGSARPYLRSTTPQIFATVSDPDGGLLQAAFEVAQLDDTVIESGLSAGVQSGSRGFRIVSAGKLVDGGTYKWRARAWDGSLYSSGYTPWCEFTVDVTAPAAPTITSTDYPAGAWRGAGGAGTFTLADTSSDVDHYLWSVNDPTPSTTTASPLTFTPGDGWQTLSVRAVDRAGNLSPVTTYSFGATPGITAPAEGAKTQGSVTLTARAEPGATEVTYHYRRSPTDAWTPIPPADVTRAGAGIGSWPVAFPAGSGDSIPPELVWNLAHTLADVDGPVQLQVCFGASCSTVPVNVTLDETAYGDAYATTAFGPGTLSLLTGNLAVAETDVSVPAYSTTLTVGRTFNTHGPGTPASGIFGPGWTAALPVDEAGSDWSGLTDAGATVTLTGSDGSITSFAKTGSTYTPTGEDADTGITLTAAGGDGNGPATFTLGDLDGNTTVFGASAFGSPPSLTSPHSYPVTAVSQPGSNQTTTFSYSGGRPTRILAPVPPGATCTDPANAATWTDGCRALVFGYDANNHLTSVTLVTNTGGAVVSVDTACYGYDAAGRLAQAWDPRDGTAGTGSHPVVCGTPVLATGYGYDAGTGRLTTITPPGLAAWSLGYDGTGRVATASRTHDAAHGGGTETSTAVYHVTLSGDGNNLEYRPGMIGSDVARWAQTDAPVTGVAIFGPGDAVSDVDLRDAEVHYLDLNGREVNTAAYSGSGAEGWHVSTTEYDAVGKVLRTLDAGNREEALAPTTGAGAALGLPADTAAAALALSTQNLYATGADGVADLVDSFGPYHVVTLPDGNQVGARAHTHNAYDTGTETGHPAGGTMHLVTSSTTGASRSQAAVATDETDVRRVDTAYALSATDATGWTFRSPMKVVADPGGIAQTTITRYDAATGAVIESRMPSNTAGGGAGTTLSVYFTAGANPQDAACGNKPAWVNLVCATKPAAQPGVAGLPGLVTTRTATYDYLNRPTRVEESVTDAAGATQTRSTVTTFLNSGYGDRVASVATTGGVGAAVPMRTTSYDPATGLATVVSAAATAENPATSASSGYDDFGRTTSYVDADEASGAARNAVTTSYDASGRVRQVTDAHTTLTYTYDGGGERRGLATKLDAVVNSTTPFTGSWSVVYDADGQVVSQTDPNGVRQDLTRDEAGALTTLVDTRIADGVMWLSDAVSSSVHGQWRTQAGPAGAHRYVYDAVGRLTTADSRPTGGVCTRRGYAFDADTNRTGVTVFPADAEGACQGATGGVSTAHSYDAADRLLATGVDAGVAYDAFGRITTTPGYGGVSGNTATSLGYYVGDLVRSMSQGSTTRVWGLDAAGRFSSVTDTVSGSVTATRTNHYDEASGDSPDWIAESADSSQS